MSRNREMTLISGVPISIAPLFTGIDQEAQAMRVIEKVKADNRTWTRTADGSYYYLKNKNVHASIESGIYDFYYNQNVGAVFLVPDQSKNRTDIIQFPDSKSVFIVKEMKKFWASEKKYKMLKKPYKRSFLLYGKPGVGKSCTISMLIEEMLKEEGIILKMQIGASAANLSSILSDIRAIEPNRRVMVIMEDIDSLLNNGQTGVSTLLNILDGTSTLHNIVFIATTNYIDRVEGRVSDRPSRFDRVIEVLPPNIETRRLYLKHLTEKFPLPEHVSIEKMAKDTEGLSYAHLTELITATCIFDDDFAASIETLKGMKKHKNSTDAKLGFGQEE